jgi:hypothetical protein
MSGERTHEGDEKPSRQVLRDVAAPSGMTSRRTKVAEVEDWEPFEDVERSDLDDH